MVAGAFFRSRLPISLADFSRRRGFRPDHPAERQELETHAAICAAWRDLVSVAGSLAWLCALAAARL